MIRLVLEFTGVLVGVPFIMLGYVLSYAAEFLIRTGAFFTGQEVIQADSDNE